MIWTALVIRAWNSTHLWAKGVSFSPMIASHTSLRLTPLLPNVLVVRILAAIFVFATVALGIAALTAQVTGERGIVPVASSSDIDVTGVEVDVRGANATEARRAGWRLAQRRAWRRIGGPSLPDSQIQAMLSAIVIERELIGPRRYQARLGVIFDRNRAGRYLGAGAQGRTSAPMLLLPVMASSGTYTMYEMRNPWQRAWAQFNPGTSRINYLRPAGAGGDSLLLNHGQTMRRSRAWWRVILDQFGAADVLVPIARLEYTYPGGPVEGTFTARYGPDNRYLDQFLLSADSPDDLPQMLTDAVLRFDKIFENALAVGILRPDPTLELDTTVEMDPELARLIELGRAIERRDTQIAAGEIDFTRAEREPAVPNSAFVNPYVVQFASPDAASIEATLAEVQGVPGVRSVAMTSLAFGGTSVMRVSFAGSLEDLAAALQARGYSVTQGADALAIRR